MHAFFLVLRAVREHSLVCLMGHTVMCCVRGRGYLFFFLCSLWFSSVDVGLLQLQFPLFEWCVKGLNETPNCSGVVGFRPFQPTLP